MLETHQHFARRLGSNLNSQQKALLDYRKSGIEAMISINQVSRCVKNRDLKGAVQKLAGAPPRFWKVVAKRFASRLRLALVPPKGYSVLGGYAS